MAWESWYGMTIPNLLNDDRVWNNVKPLKNEINYTPQITSVYGRNSCQRCESRTAIWLLQQLIWLTGSQFSLLTGQGVHRTYGSQKAGHLSKELHSDMQKSTLQKHGESSGHLPWTAGFLFGWFATEYSPPDPPGSVWIQLALDRNETCLLGLGDSAAFGSSTVSWLCMRWEMSGILPDFFYKDLVNGCKWGMVYDILCSFYASYMIGFSVCFPNLSSGPRSCPSGFHLSVPKNEAKTVVPELGLL